MPAILGYESAVAILEKEARREFAHCNHIDSVYDDESVPGWEECAQMKSRLGLSKLHLIVPAADERKASIGTTYHVWPSPLPKDSLIKREDGLVVSSPEFCLLQMATELSETELARLIMQFCGTFSPDSKSPTGTVDRNPMTSILSIELYLDGARGCAGANRLRRALRWAVDNAHSPREACLEILMVMPQRRGGYHFPKPEMNVEPDDLTSEARDILGQEHCVVDLWWRRFLLAMEYLGETSHSDKFGSDLARVRALSTMGVLVLLVAKEQFEDARQMDMIAQEAARQIGRQVRPDRWPKTKQTQKLIDELRKPLPTKPQ